MLPPDGDEPLVNLPAKCVEYLMLMKEQTKNHHHINAWECDICGNYTVCINIHTGVTPMFLGCRRVWGCHGMARSFGYPEELPPKVITDLLAWEWYRPSQTEYDKLDLPNRNHVDSGGLLLRKIREEN